MLDLVARIISARPLGRETARRQISLRPYLPSVRSIPAFDDGSPRIRFCNFFSPYSKMLLGGAAMENSRSGMQCISIDLVPPLFSCSDKGEGENLGGTGFSMSK